jgi:hypothetical protein
MPADLLHSAAMSMLGRMAPEEPDAHGRANATFFRLPPEVRETVYRHVFPENVLHFWENRLASRGKGPYCHTYQYAVSSGQHSANEFPLTGHALRCIENLDCRQGYSHFHCDWLLGLAKQHMLGLPLACRQLVGAARSVDPF